jgi:hypothetical protein
MIGAQESAMTRTAAVAALLLAFALPGRAALEPQAAFDKLKSFAGRWDAKMADNPEETKVSYRVTAGGSTVVETLFEGAPHEMVTMYFMEGKDLRATHYCAMGNQPSFRFDAGASSPEKLVFAFAGGTGFKPGRDAHVHDGFIDVSSASSLHAEWAVWKDGKRAGAHVLTMTRQ